MTTDSQTTDSQSDRASAKPLDMFEFVHEHGGGNDYFAMRMKAEEIEDKAERAARHQQLDWLKDAILLEHARSGAVERGRKWFKNADGTPGGVLAKQEVALGVVRGFGGGARQSAHDMMAKMAGGETR